MTADGIHRRKSRSQSAHHDVRHDSFSLVIPRTFCLTAMLPDGYAKHVSGTSILPRPESTVCIQDVAAGDDHPARRTGRGNPRRWTDGDD